MKKLTSIISLALALAASPLMAGAQTAADEVTLLTVNLKDGQKEQYNLPDEPTVTFEQDKLKIASASINGEYDFDAVSHFSFDSPFRPSTTSRPTTPTSLSHSLTTPPLSSPPKSSPMPICSTSGAAGSSRPMPATAW